MKKSILGIICVILVIAFSSFCIDANAANPNVNVKNDWNYSNYIDKTDGSMTKRAFVFSSNVLNFDPPYDGGSELAIMIYGSEKVSVVGIGVIHGEFNLEDDEINYVRVSFDNGAPILFLTEPSDDSSNLLFLKDYNTKKFIELAKKAKTIKIEAPFFNEGWRAFTFSTNKPLEW